MSIGLAGAHRVGKSTLARAFAEQGSFEFVPSRVSEIFKDMKLPVGGLLSCDDRMTLQERVLDQHLKDVRALVGNPWIADRSTLDFATYTLLDAAQDSTYDHARVAAYVDRCLREASKLYGVIALVQPGIAYVEEDGKPPANVSQQEAFNLILWGLAQDPRLGCRTAYIQRDRLTVESRVEALTQLTGMIMMVEMKEMEGKALH